MMEMEETACVESLLLEMEDFARQYHIPILRQEERNLLRDIARRSGARRILEVGTAIGYSALLLAASAPAAEVLTIEVDAARMENARRFVERSPFSNRISLRLGEAQEILLHLEGEFDFLFLDAAKGQYLRFLQAALPRLTKEAVIVADNVSFRGMVRSAAPPPKRYRTIVRRLRAYLDYVQGEGFVTEISGLGDGLAITRRVHGNTTEA